MKFFPISLEIESTQLCDVNPPCVMCCRNTGPGSGHLRDYVLDKMSPYWKYLKKVSFHGIGEVFFYPKLNKLIEMSNHVNMGFTTGGHLLNKENAEFLVDNNLDFISISIDAATRETHDKIRGTGFDSIIENIIYMQEYKNKQGKSTPHLIMNAVLMRENIDEASRIIELAWQLDAHFVTFVELGGSLNYKINRNGFFFDYEWQKTKNIKDEYDRNLVLSEETAKFLGSINIDMPSLYGERKKIDLDFERLKKLEKIVPKTKGLVETDKSQFWINQELPDYVNDKLICTRPWETVWINCMGDVSFCCHQSEFIGSLKENTFEEIWFGQKAEEIRNKILNGSLHSFCTDSKNVCRQRSKFKINLVQTKKRN